MMKTINSTKTKCARRSGLLRMVFAGTVFCATSSAFAVIVSLKTVSIPVPLNIGNYIANQFAAEQLGKALFWDMQVGSDGVQACATCHFHAGADSRTTNQLSPGILGGDEQYGNNNIGLPQPAPGALRPDMTLTSTHFPLHRLTNQHVMGEPLSNPANVVSDTNDVVSSQGVMLTQFIDIVPGSPVDDGTVIVDPPFTTAEGTQVRRVEPRNTPTVINAVFNFENFHDGRANNIFNGNNPFGPADPRQHLIVNTAGNLATQELRLRQSSLASQAVGPPLSDFEMSWRGRTWPKVGKKMLSLRPLAQQQVSGSDSKLGFLSSGAPGGTGLNTTYAAMIRAAFPSQYWNNTTQKVVFDAEGIPSFQPWDGVTPLTTDEYSQMEANFAFFFGLAVQMYETTLVANDSKFDQFMDGSGALTNEEILGMNTFTGAGACILCHDGGTMMDVNTALIQGKDPVTDLPIPLNQNPLAANEFMQIVTGFGIYDNGFHNTGVRPSGNPDSLAPDYLAQNEDVGRGGTTGLGGTLTEISLSKGILGLQNIGGPTPQVPSLDPLPGHMAGWVPPLPLGFLATDTSPFAGRVTNFGAFKTPGLRNIALTGPYMHNGGLSTLRQVVDFYVRGGDFAFTNAMNFDSQGLTVLPQLRDSGAIPGLPTPEQLRDALTQFMMALTDQRVANEIAPFDHPEIFVPISGTAPVSPGTRAGLLADSTNFQQIPAVGSGGRGSAGLPPLGTFLDLNPRSAALDPDTDRDLIANAADNCPLVANPFQEDVDGDGAGDVCDVCPIDPANDIDADGFCADVDNCPLIANADQTDTDGDGNGDACDDDDDNDGLPDVVDIDLLNPFMCTDSDADTCDDCSVGVDQFGPLADNDPANDGLDTDSDGLCDAGDPDDDNDGVPDTGDNCPATPTGAAVDANGCALSQLDTDGDGVTDDLDNCTLVANADQRDTNADGYGNICDADFTGDLLVNLSDYSVFRSAFGTADPDADFNGDGVVNLSDYSIFRASFGKAPGPSCCGTP